MTVSELQEIMNDYDRDDLVPLDIVIPDLTYIVAALEQFQEVAELFGRSVDVEVEAFLAQAENCL